MMSLYLHWHWAKWNKSLSQGRHTAKNTEFDKLLGGLRPTFSFILKLEQPPPSLPSPLKLLQLNIIYYHLNFYFLFSSLLASNKILDLKNFKIWVKMMSDGVHEFKYIVVCVSVRDSMPLNWVWPAHHTPLGSVNSTLA